MFKAGDKVKVVTPEGGHKSPWVTGMDDPLPDGTVGVVQSPDGSRGPGLGVIVGDDPISWYIHPTSLQLIETQGEPHAGSSTIQ